MKANPKKRSFYPKVKAVKEANNPGNPRMNSRPDFWQSLLSVPSSVSCDWSLHLCVFVLPPLQSWYLGELSSIPSVERDSDSANKCPPELQHKHHWWTPGPRWDGELSRPHPRPTLPLLLGVGAGAFLAARKRALQAWTKPAKQPAPHGIPLPPAHLNSTTHTPSPLRSCTSSWWRTPVLKWRRGTAQRGGRFRSAVSRRTPTSQLSCLQNCRIHSDTVMYRCLNVWLHDTLDS